MTPNTSRTPASPGLSASALAALITIPTVAVIVGVAILLAVLNRPSAEDVAAERAATPAAADDSHYLDRAGDDAPTLVEFLDFECEVCAAVYPDTEEIREEYAGRINYVIRYFPLGGHRNSMTAAIAVEAAAQQGAFEQMYARMLESQREWGERQDSEAPRFRGYAEELGLDLTAYDAAVADPATQERVERDYAAGEKLGVSGTPTFFVDGELLEISFTSEISEALDAALAKR